MSKTFHKLSFDSENKYITVTRKGIPLDIPLYQIEACVVETISCCNKYDYKLYLRLYNGKYIGFKSKKLFKKYSSIGPEGSHNARMMQARTIVTKYNKFLTKCKAGRF